MFIISGYRKLQIEDEDELKHVQAMFNIQMRVFDGEEPKNERGENIVVKCGLGKSSMTFNQNYRDSSAGKISYK